MPIGQIQVNRHREQYGKNSEQDTKIRRKVSDLIAEVLAPLININTLDVYNMGGSARNYNAGSDSRAVIFAHNTQEGAGNEKSDQDIVIGSHAFSTKVLKPLGNGKVITSENGVPIAEHNARYNELNILFDIFEEYDDLHMDAFKYILQQWYEAVWKVKEMENSWVHTEDKAALTSRFSRRLEEQGRRALAEQKEAAETYSRRIEEYKNKIRTNYDNMIRTRNNIETQEKNLANVGQALIKDLDLIVAHPKVSDLHIKDGKFIIFVPKVCCYDDQDRKFYLGNFRIEIKLENTQVKFFGDNPRHSYWTSRDPHPHVSGRDGSACLGNIAATIAELCSRNEVYALALVCIDFLESVNTSDPAGRNVTNWERADEEGNPIQRERQRENTWTCEHCGGEQSEDTQQITAYPSREDADEQENELTICPDCRDRHYHYDDDIEEYVQD